MSKELALRQARLVVMPGRLPRGRTAELINDPVKVSQGPWGLEPGVDNRHDLLPDVAQHVKDCFPFLITATLE